MKCMQFNFTLLEYQKFNTLIVCANHDNGNKKLILSKWITLKIILRNKTTSKWFLNDF